MEELWKAIPDFETYEVSNLGRVRNTKTEKILKPLEDSYGYLTVGLYNQNHKRPCKKKIHNLVATAFCERPNDNRYRVPDHIDRDKKNNRADNLRWATRRENALNAECWGPRINRFEDPVVLVKDGKIVARYKSCHDASKQTGLAVASIATNIAGKRKSFKIGDFFLEKNLDKEKYF